MRSYRIRSGITVVHERPELAWIKQELLIGLLPEVEIVRNTKLCGVVVLCPDSIGLGNIMVQIAQLHIEVLIGPPTQRCVKTILVHDIGPNMFAELQEGLGI